MAMTAASAATMVLPLPTSPCSRRFMGRGSFMSPAISCDDALLRLGGLERQHGLDLLAHAVVNFETRCRAACAPCCASSATPHSSQKNSSKIRRNCAGERKSLSRRRSVSGGGKCVSRIAVQRLGIACRRWRMMLGQAVLFRRERFQDAMGDGAQHARGELAGGLVDRRRCGPLWSEASPSSSSPERISNSGCSMVSSPE